MKRTWLYIIGALVLLTVFGGSMSSPLDVIIDRFAQAVGLAEGFFVTGSRPQRNHNPGNLTRDLISKGVGWDGPFVKYATDADGWDNLKQQIREAFDGTSGLYDPSMTIQEFANVWTKTDQLNWANTVASQLGVTVNTPLSQIT